MKRYGHSFPATKLNAKRIPKYLNGSVQKGERSYLDDSMVIEEKEKTNPGPISWQKHTAMPVGGAPPTRKCDFIGVS